MPAKQKAINLALQGGGSHGAFTWGVLDRFLEDSRIRIEGISGASAGAMNGVVVADGLMKDGEDGARQGLHDFWEKVSQAGRLSPVQRTPIDVFMGNWSLDYSPSYFLFDLMNQVASPYQTNPLNLNPLQDILEDTVCFDQIRACNKLKLFISATNVEDGKVRVFEQDKLTSDMVMASACLPFVFQAVEIDETPYWDGGYMGNPVLFPFFYNCKSSDIVIVQINPIERQGTPKTPREIMDRVNEITFNGSLLKELRSIDFVHRLLQEDRIDPKKYKDIKIHIVEAQKYLKEFGASSKINAEWAFLKHLFSIGRDAADRWLDENYKSIGKKSSVDLKAMFQGQ